MRRYLWQQLYRLRFQLFQKHRFDALTLENVDGTPLVVLPSVFNPMLFLVSRWMARQLGEELVPAGCRALELGTGSGLGALRLADRAAHVVATDINPVAVRCARINALLNDQLLDVRQGDLFAPVAGERFDVILFNPPYLSGEPTSALDQAFRAPRVAGRFSADLAPRLTPTGYALLLLSSIGEEDRWLAALAAHGLTVTVARRADLRSEVVTLYRVGSERKKPPDQGGSLGNWEEESEE